MANMKTLAKLVRELEDQLVVCMRCGMCQAVCPLYAETGRESDVARGKLALLDGLMQELFNDPDGVSERLNKCLLCGSCAANCPSGVNVLEIFIKARKILTDFKGLSPAKKLVLRGMLARPELFNRLMEWAPKFQKLFTKPASTAIGTSCARFASPLLGHRHFKPIASKPYHTRVPELDTPAGRSGIRVAFYVGCLIDKIFPHIAEAVVDVLDYHGIGIFMPPDQGCCGIPAVSSGDFETFQRLVRHNLTLFDNNDFDYLVTACATCTSTIKKIWPLLADGDNGFDEAQVADIADRTIDINQLLAPLIDAETQRGSAEEKVFVTYHDPCHLKKSLGVTAEPRALINANPNYRLKEMAEADRCCGLGGSFNLQYYDLSANIGRLKRDHIKASGCSVVATSCPACMLQISDMLSQAGDDIRVKHPIEIYRESRRKS